MCVLSIFPEDQLPPGFPTIDMGPQLKVVERSRTATMLCAASGNPDPEITWFKDFLPVNTSNNNGRIKQLRSGDQRLSLSLSLARPLARPPTASDSHLCLHPEVFLSLPATPPPLLPVSHQQIFVTVFYFNPLFGAAAASLCCPSDAVVRVNRVLFFFAVARLVFVLFHFVFCFFPKAFFLKEASPPLSPGGLPVQITITKP